MNYLSVLAAFSAGLGSFFAPCVLPLMPAYVSYLTGVSLNNISRTKLLAIVVMYVVGFSLVFTLLGASLGGIGSFFREHTRALQIIGGAAMVVFGLEFLGYLHLDFLNRGKVIKLPKWMQNFEYLRSFFIGVLFAITWTPCVGALLGGILSLAAASATAVTGAIMLFAYSLGISIPFVLFSIFVSSTPHYFSKHKKVFVIISKFAGVVLIVFGLLLVTDLYKHLNSNLFSIAYQLGWKVR